MKGWLEEAAAVFVLAEQASSDEKVHPWLVGKVAVAKKAVLFSHPWMAL